MTARDPEHDYDVQLDRLVNSLHSLADEVRNIGDARRPRFEGISSIRRDVDRTILAGDVHDRIMQWVGRPNSNLTCLMFAAIQAQHVTARGEPGELIGAAADAIAEYHGDSVGLSVDSKVLAVAALRGAGVIR